jgi:predicted O-methyltransferase YrrM
MLKTAFKFLAYKLFSRHRRGHGIHSPFVYSFIREVLFADYQSGVLTELKNWHCDLEKKYLPESRREFGAGSGYRILKSRRIRAGRIGISRKFGAMLFRLVRFISPRQIIELGTGSGISTAWLASANASIPCKTVEGDIERMNFSKQNLSELGIRNVEFINKNFDDFLAVSEKFENPFVVFIDGNHSYSATLKYFRYFSKKADEHSVLVFDDIRWSEEMEKAWKEIKESPETRITIDLFFMGIVFFREGITKQNFVVNF